MATSVVAPPAPEYDENWEVNDRQIAKINHLFSLGAYAYQCPSFPDEMCSVILNLEGTEHRFSMRAVKFKPRPPWAPPPLKLITMEEIHGNHSSTNS